MGLEVLEPVKVVGTEEGERMEHNCSHIDRSVVQFAVIFVQFEPGEVEIDGEVILCTELLCRWRHHMIRDCLVRTLGKALQRPQVNVRLVKTALHRVLLYKLLKVRH